MVDAASRQRDVVTLSHHKLSVEEAVAAVTAPCCGAVSLFIGVTRDSFEARRVVRLEYEAYESMAITEMRKVCAAMRHQWPAVEYIAVAHRLGVVPVEEASVVIAVSSPHRRDSLDAVSYCIDSLKATVPIWKKEVYDTDEYSWRENKECTWAEKQEKHECGTNVRDSEDAVDTSS
ncbi:molybdopterin synthase catalytic subunit-like [Petromyzon marinus]|uniref:molybdopterin synthase catalytic subunit-like n=1 Tax=Petromyzon marinus TaxID=7757 RepID=UPI003F6E9773